ncbi:MAG: hypothetical protein J6K84_05160 [Oscillospiraceae bacterium]|nr:hypothetical protein [Oscillospiraceae bacterium]
MKKRLLIGLVLVILVLCACEKAPQNSSTPVSPDTISPDPSMVVPIESVPFQAQYIRTGGFYEDTFPKTQWITSKDELWQYIRDNNEKYQLELSGLRTEFMTAIMDYDEAFFAEKNLIFVVVEEGSGSNRHEVTDMRLMPSSMGRVSHLLQPSIRRIVPEVGTCDMAQWHILIEVDKQYAPDTVQLLSPKFE